MVHSLRLGTVTHTTIDMCVGDLISCLHNRYNNVREGLFWDFFPFTICSTPPTTAADKMEETDSPPVQKHPLFPVVVGVSHAQHSCPPGSL